MCGREREKEKERERKRDREKERERTREIEREEFSHNKTINGNILKHHAIVGQGTTL